MARMAGRRGRGEGLTEQLAQHWYQEPVQPEP